MKTSKQLERYFKGSANHRRISILLFISKNKGATVEDVVLGLNTNIKTISQHTKALVQAGLLNKYHQGRNVAHDLSPYGERFVAFIKTFA